MEGYISEEHAIRAIGYVGGSLANAGMLPDNYEQPGLLDLWKEALQATAEPEIEAWEEQNPMGAAADF